MMREERGERRDTRVHHLGERGERRTSTILRCAWQQRDDMSVRQTGGWASLQRRTSTIWNVLRLAPFQLQYGWLHCWLKPFSG